MKIRNLGNHHLAKSLSSPEGACCAAGAKLVAGIIIIGSCTPEGKSTKTHGKK